MRKNKANGFVTALAAMVALAVLIFFSGIYYVIQIGTRENIIIDFRDKSADVAEAGIQDVINTVRANPDLADLDKNMRVPDPASPYYKKTLGLPDNVCNACGAEGDADGDQFFSIYSPFLPKPLIDSKGKRVGMYFAKAKRFNVDDPGLAWHNNTTGIFVHSNTISPDPVTGDIFHIITEGYALDKNGKPMSHAVAHAFVTLSNVGDYFCAVKGQLTLQPGAQLQNAKVYGGTVNFNLEDPQNPAGPGNPIKLMEADYMIDVIPDCNSGDWPSGLSPLTGAIMMPNFPFANPPGSSLTSNCNTQNFKSIDNGLVFPSLDEQFVYYKHINTPVRCDFSGDLYIPARTDPTVDNTQHAYLCAETSSSADPLLPGGDVVIGDTHVHGQVIIAAMGNVHIRGSITIDDGDLGNTPKSKSKSTTCPGVNCYVPPDGPAFSADPRFSDIPQGLPSTADQLVIYANKGVFYDGDWCTVTGGNLKLQGVLIISPNGKIKYDPNPTSCVNYAAYSLDYLGAMFLADQPTLGNVFPQNRVYRYLETLRTDPPPVREFYEIIRQFVRRKGTAAPIPTPS